MDCEIRNRSLYENKNFGELLFILNPECRSLARKLERLQKKVVHSSYGVVFNKTCINEYIYMYMACPIGVAFDCVLLHASAVGAHTQYSRQKLVQ